MPGDTLACQQEFRRRHPPDTLASLGWLAGRMDARTILDIDSRLVGLWLIREMELRSWALRTWAMITAPDTDCAGNSWPSTQRFSTVMRFCVSVPVLSDAITVTDPSVCGG